MIYKSEIEKLDPHPDILRKILPHFHNEVITIDEFLELKDVSHFDKLWILFPLMSKSNLNLVKIDIAKSFLSAPKIEQITDNDYHSHVEYFNSAVYDPNLKYFYPSRIQEYYNITKVCEYAIRRSVDKKKQEKLQLEIIRRYWK